MKLAELRSEAVSTTQAVLGCLQELLEATEPEPLHRVLESLAEAFAVSGSGLTMSANSAQTETLLAESYWQETPPEHSPWDVDRDLIGKVRRSREPLAMADGEGIRWLMVRLQSGERSGFLWLASHQPRSWTNQEKASLDLAGKCLTQRLIPAPPVDALAPWQQHVALQDSIDKAAGVTRRLAHDFCNILTSILGFAELALLQMKPDSPPYHFVKEVLEAARMGAGWSQKLQMFSLQHMPHGIPTEVATVLTEESARPHWYRDVALEIDVPTELPAVAIEKESLRLVLTALLDNAREAVGKLGTVSVSAQLVDLPAGACLELLGDALPGPHVEVTIADSGPGLSPEARQRLFRETFFTTKGRRRGLGLAVVYGILRSCQAGFRLLPDAPQGTTVHIYLPVAVDRQNNGKG